MGRGFLNLAETRSFSRSALVRGATQSAFSRRIRCLEVWLGTVLLDRSTYPITLTAGCPVHRPGFRHPSRHHRTAHDGPREMVTSKGIAGVPRASLVVVAATVPMFGLPAAGILLIMGIDQILDMGRTVTNVLGNGLATAAVARWQGEIEDAPQPASGADEAETPAKVMAAVAKFPLLHQREGNRFKAPPV
ncbi:cation:dicarboxylate symporter family transporter [Methylobacterium carpenticola]|uniref:cation:dicarboxylate symporter family transporter n=1 Tax=Methylobacterium carpenticola TaxID=3344827 RepID=UPI003F882045